MNTINQASVVNMILVSLKNNNITAEYGFIVSSNDECVRVGSIRLTKVSHAIRLNEHIMQSIQIEYNS